MGLGIVVGSLRLGFTDFRVIADGLDIFLKFRAIFERDAEKFVAESVVNGRETTAPFLLLIIIKSICAVRCN